MLFRSLSLSLSLSDSDVLVCPSLSASSLTLVRRPCDSLDASESPRLTGLQSISESADASESGDRTAEPAAAWAGPGPRGRCLPPRLRLLRGASIIRVEPGSIIRVEPGSIIRVEPGSIIRVELGSIIRVEPGSHWHWQPGPFPS